MVSIIVPVYNTEKYLKDCLESLVKQTYDKIEIILVDDGSTDSSGKICDKWAKIDDRIHVYHKKMKGYQEQEIMEFSEQKEKN
ncbi:cpsJ protein [Lachnospiraceae bacterium 5_1_63FAA]|nr:cpsJ protein [Lachnospiraceae bacterium 5_1_63FAA]